MARDRDLVSKDEIDALREAMDAQREDIREALAEDLGGEPEDYHTGKRTVAGGSEDRSMKSETDIRDRLDSIPDGERYEIFGAGYVAALEWVLDEGETGFGEWLDDESEE